MHLPDAESCAAADAPLDRNHLDRATQGDAALAREVLGLFLGQLDAFMADFACGAAPTPFELHRMKGAARAIGAWPLAAAARALEGVEADASGLARLDAAMAGVRAAIAAHYGVISAGAGAARTDSL